MYLIYLSVLYSIKSKKKKKKKSCGKEVKIVTKEIFLPTTGNGRPSKCVPRDAFSFMFQLYLSYHCLTGSLTLVALHLLNV